MTTRILVVCTANQCRSPLGEVIVRRDAEAGGHDIVVGSAGTRAYPGVAATERAIATAGKLGLDLSQHVSRPVTDDLVAGSDLIVAMERDHVMTLVADHGAPLARTFTMPELASYAAGHPARDAGETLDDWLHRIAAGRTPHSAMGSAPEIDDPIGRSMRRYRASAKAIATASAVILGSGWG